jgi:hypothetical protein
MSTDIQKLMQILDENKENIPGNDYLMICSLMKNIYDTPQCSIRYNNSKSTYQNNISHINI